MQRAYRHQKSKKTYKHSWTGTDRAQIFTIQYQKSHITDGPGEVSGPFYCAVRGFYTGMREKGTDGQ